MPQVKTIAVTVESHLCVGCGACTATCPVDAIELIETMDGRLVPKINENECNRCGHCLLACPGISITGIESFLAEHQPFEGPCLSAFVAHATDKVLHSHGQSGGVATSIALKLLELGRIDGVLVSRLDWEGGRPRGRTFIARNRDELLSSQGSKYCPMPLFEALNPGIAKPERLAVICLPCHMHAIHNLRKLQPKMGNQISLTIGLFCDRTLTYAAIEYLARRADIHPSDILSFAFRDKARTGYPGDVCFLTRDGGIKALPNSERMRIKEQFTPLRCRFCFDKLNVLSDITIGDPYGVPEADLTNGESVLLARTKAGENIAKLCLDTNVLQARVIDYKTVLAGQGINNKKKNWHEFVHAWESLGGLLPIYTKQISGFLPKISSDDPAHAPMLVQSLNQERCSNREDLLQSVAIRLGEHEPYFGSISDRHFIVEIMGCGFVNKGAMLMMLSVIEQLKEHRPDAKVAVAPKPQIKRFLDYDILPLIPGFIELPDINVVLDASGFTYSDMWKIAPTRMTELALRFEKLKSYGAALILLPQAFGPFRNPVVRACFERIAASANLIFVRDQVSLEHVRSVVGDDPKVSIAPDFTILLEPKQPLEPGRYSGKTCIVPNVRMLDQTSAKKGTRYLDFLKMTVLAVHAMGKDAFFLIHEGRGDFEIAQRINTMLDKKCEIVQENDPLLLKGILGASAVVVSSRYHALIGSLSQAVPSICVGWSHKYDELFRDYGFAKGLMDVDVTRDRLHDVLSTLLDCETRSGIVERLSSAARNQKKMARIMWRQVFDFIDKFHPLQSKGRKLPTPRAMGIERLTNPHTEGTDVEQLVTRSK